MAGEKLISPIAVDLGGTTSGVFLRHQQDCRRVVVMHHSDAKLSQVSRRQKRHQWRNNERRKLAKRLLWLVLREHFAIPKMPTDRCDFINGLLNRRGFLHLSEELAELESDEYKNLSVQTNGTWLHENKPDYFPRGMAIFESLATSDKRKEVIECLQEALEAKLSPNSEEKKYIKKAKKVLSSLDMEERGYFERDKYFCNIKEDIDAFAEKGKLPLPPDTFWHLVSHLSNLPLRPLRRYFCRFRDGKDKWNAELLKKCVLREVENWRPKSAKQRNQKKEYMQRLKGQDDIIAMWTADDFCPPQSIPPFESRTNRAIPPCRTLLLRRAVAEKCGLDLDACAEMLCRQRPSLAEGLERKDRFYKERMVQRFYDLTRSENAPFRMRDLCHAEDAAAEYAEQYKNLQQEIGEHAAALVAFGRKYYPARDAGKRGDWVDDEDSALFCCGRNPPRKGKMARLFIAQLLGLKNIPDDLQPFCLFLECTRHNEKYKRSRTIMNWCQEAQKMQKKHGNRLNDMRSWTEDSKDVKEVKKLFAEAKEVGQKICQHWNLPSERAAQGYGVGSPFSLAQLWQHLRGDVKGFSHNCRQCGGDNVWRSAREMTDEPANAVRLPADSTRPFDGVVARLLEGKAVKIAAAKIKQLQDADYQGGEINIPIYIEQNKFAFALSLQAIRDNKWSKEKRREMESALQNSAVRAQDKKERIAQNEICPYTGQNISHGEIDHIIPRAYCKRFGRGVFNSEANLLLCSHEGNRDKSDRFYSLEELAGNYLRAVFGDDDVANIKRRISGKMEEFWADRPRGAFGDWGNEEQICVRHALFMEEYRDRVMNEVLAHEGKTAVNGTQKYFARALWKSLEWHFKNLGWSPKPRRFLTKVQPNDVALWRWQLGEDWAKEERQGAASHVADAAMVWALAASGEDDDVEKLRGLVEGQTEIIHWDGKPPYRKDVSKVKWFGDTLYAERFMSVLLSPEGEMRVGFVWDTAAPVRETSEGALFAVLSPFLRDSSVSFDDWKERAKKAGYAMLTPQRQRALAFLHDYARRGDDHAEEMTQKQAALLRALRYTTTKKSVDKLLYPKSDADTKKQADEPPDQSGGLVESWQGKISISPNPPSIRKCGFSWERKRIDAPFARAWQKVAKAMKESKPADGYELRKFLRGYFLPNEKDTPERKHHKRRAVFSLPIVDAPKSGGFRARRSTDRGEDVYQLLPLEAGGYEGLDAEGKGVRIAHLLTSPRLSPIEDEKMREVSVAFDEWSELSPAEFMPPEVAQRVNRLRVSLATLKRPALQVWMPTEDFLAWANLGDNWRSLTPLLSMSKSPDWSKILGDGIQPEADRKIRLLETGPRQIGFQLSIKKGAGATKIGGWHLQEIKRKRADDEVSSQHGE